MRKPNTNKTQILHGIRLRKYNHKKPPEDSCQETQWQIEVNDIISQDDLYTHAWETEFAGHMFDNPIIQYDPNVSDIDENHTLGPDTVIVPRSFFPELNDDQDR